jgi:hypothetical protein
MFRRIKVFGLQRTGTNFLHLLIFRNIRGKFALVPEADSKQIGKHSWHSPETLFETVDKAVVIQKDIYSWIVSRCKFGQRSLSDLDQVAAYLNEYYSYYNLWARNESKHPLDVYLTHYELFLTPKDQIYQLKRLATFLKGRVKSKYWPVTGTMRTYPEENKLNLFDHLYYIKKQYLNVIPPETMELINSFRR